jgi:cytochrome c oxidase subunit III
VSRRRIDVSELPVAGFGDRGLLYWGTLLLIAIEGTTITIVLASYLDLMRLQPAWPPPPTRPPDLLIPTINLVLILASIIPIQLAARAAKQLDAARAANWLWGCVALGTVCCVLRWFEFDALNSRWDDHVYGSLSWLLLSLHASLLFTDVGEESVMALILRSKRLEAKHYSDVEDAALYQWFMALIWVPIYFLVFVVPRL